jgi:hypothetical protein
MRGIFEDEARTRFVGRADRQTVTEMYCAFRERIDKYDNGRMPPILLQGEDMLAWAKARSVGEILVIILLMCGLIVAWIPIRNALSAWSKLAETIVLAFYLSLLGMVALYGVVIMALLPLFSLALREKSCLRTCFHYRIRRHDLLLNPEHNLALSYSDVGVDLPRV